MKPGGTMTDSSNNPYPEPYQPNPRIDTSLEYRPRRSRGNVLASRSKVRGFKHY